MAANISRYTVSGHLAKFNGSQYFPVYAKLVPYTGKYWQPLIFGEYKVWWFARTNEVAQRFGGTPYSSYM